MQQLCWKGVLTSRSQSDSSITVEIFWSILITWQVPRQQTAPWCSNADTSQNPTACNILGGGGNYLIPALKTRIQLQPVLSPTVLLICPLPVSVSPQTSSCNATNMLFTKRLREMIPAGAHLIPQLLPWNKDQERGEKVTPKEKAVGLKSPVEMKQSFSVCD